jgi:hypothetical protein
MPCCGQNREQARTAVKAPTSPMAAVSVQAVKPASSIQERPAVSSSGSITRLRYAGVAEIVVRGARSGRAYAFSRSAPERVVESVDVDALMRTGLFRRVG